MKKIILTVVLCVLTLNTALAQFDTAMFVSDVFLLDNYIKRQNKTFQWEVSNFKDTPEEVYNVNNDIRLHSAYDMIKQELDTLKSTKMWTSAKLYELYAFSELTMEELSKEVGISKSTVFLNIKKVKQHLKILIDNPFKDMNDEL